MKKRNKGQPPKANKKKKIAAEPSKKSDSPVAESGSRNGEPDYRGWNENNPENQIVNEQNQNSAINRQDEYYKENRGSSVTENTRDESSDIDGFEGDNIDPQPRVEGDDAGTLERKVPNL